MSSSEANSTSSISFDIEGKSDEEILEYVLDLHKPSRNFLVRWVWELIVGLIWRFLVNSL